MNGNLSRLQSILMTMLLGLHTFAFAKRSNPLKYYYSPRYSSPQHAQSYYKSTLGFVTQTQTQSSKSSTHTTHTQMLLCTSNNHHRHHYKKHVFTPLTSFTQTRTLKMGRISKTLQQQNLPQKSSQTNLGSNHGTRMNMVNDNYESSWMDKNERGSENNVSSFRDNFRGTRVFVQGIPLHVSWQTLKDHFRIAGNVVFASVSIDKTTNQSKGHGIVQFETVEEAKNAIQIMRNHPMEDISSGTLTSLYVRPDHQESKYSDSATYVGRNGHRNDNYDNSSSRRQRTLWKCANDSEDDLSTEEYTAVLNIIKARDASRKRKNFDAADAMREQLKEEYNIHLDDRLKLWWKDLSMDGSVPDKVQNIKGDGHWKNKPSQQSEEWRQIPTTAEKDACVDPNLIQALLTQRDIARMEKDYYTADTLLEQAMNAPNVEGFTLRIHDASRTWRVWSVEAPQQKVRDRENFDNQRLVSRKGQGQGQGSSPGLGPVEQCLALVEKYDPEKKMEVKNLLKKFPGREYNILKKLKQRYREENKF